MNHFFRSSTSAGGGACPLPSMAGAVSAGASVAFAGAACGGSDSSGSDSGAMSSASPGCSSAIISDCGCSSGNCFSSSMGAPLLFRHHVVKLCDGLKNERINHLKKCRESEDRQNDHRGGGLHLLAAGPRHALHFVLQFADVIFRGLGPLFETL